jgi:hypothetical protein
MESSHRPTADSALADDRPRHYRDHLLRADRHHVLLWSVTPSPARSDGSALPPQIHSGTPIDRHRYSATGAVLELARGAWLG